MPHAHTAPSSGPGSGSGGVGGTNGVAGSSNAASGSGSAGSGVSWRAMPSSSTRRHAQSHHDPAGSSSVAPSATSPSSFPSSPYHSNGNNSNNIANKGHFASSSSSSPTTSSSNSGFQRAPVPKPKKYIGHYDIADRTFQLLSRHRAAACILFWSLTILLDILLQLPIEWFFLFYFILALVFRIFFIGGHIVLISIGAMCVTNAIVFYTIPFSFTSPFATGVAFGLMVSLIHGLNLKGVILAMTMYMLKPYLERQTLIAALNPPTVPSIVFLAPLAAFCSAFGVLWLLYDLFGYLHASTDDLRDFFGITLPAPSIVTLKDVKDRSITLNWQCSSQATISKHLIEIDGLIIGESGKQETSVVIQGLYPENTYRIRLWAITTRNWKTPSDYIIVRTLPPPPVELLELSSVENARRESELTKEAQLQQQTTAAIDESTPNDTTLKTEPENESNQATLETPSPTPPSSSVPPPPSPTSTHPTISVESRLPSPRADVSEEQIAAIRKELESKEAAQAVLMQQLADMERQYRQQEDSLKSEILKLREQQKQDDEPRQQAKVKLRELEESLRESEVNKSKIEKEHRMEIDKRQRIADQMAAKQRKLDQLQKNLRQSQDKLEAEKASHRQQKQELELSLKKRMEDVVAAETSLKELHESQQSLTATIEAKEAELQKLQVSLNSPKSLFSWEQKSKDLDVKCAQLTEQLLQYKTENQQLQERLLEASKNVAKVRDERETRKTQTKNESLPDSDVVAQYSDMYPTQLSRDIGSSWSGGWGQSLGTRILNGLFQDETPQERPAPTRRATGPPPGLPPKAPTMDVTTTEGAIGARGRKDSGSHGSYSEINTPIGHQLKNRQNSGLRPRSSSILSVESSFMDPNKYLGTESPLPTTSEAERFQDTRSRTSSVSSITGFHSPLFEPSFVFSGQQQPTDLSHSPQIHHRSSLQRHQLSQSPRARFQNVSQQSPPMGGAHANWGSSSPMKTKATPGSVGNRFVSDDNKAPPPTPSQPFNYHRFFGPTNDPPGMFSDGSSGHGHLDYQMNEQNVIKSMFEAPEGDLRHQLRTVGSHSSLGTQSKILPSHLRSISTPASSSPLASPTKLTSYQQQSPIWDFKPIARPGTLGRVNSQAEGSSTSLNISDTSSPTSPHLAAFTQPPPGFARKPYVKDQSGDRGLWGYETRRSQDSLGPDSVGSSGLSFDDRGVPGANTKWFNETLAFDPESWTHEARPKRLVNVSSHRESGYSIDSLASPTESSSSSLDTGTPLSVDAHARVFAEQYFSGRPFETSTLSSGPKPPGSDLSKVGRRETKTESTATTGGGDIFGYGLNLNPFGWLPADVEENPKSDS
ncbi:hypothetical protein BGZ52_000904 [Haplosporangium bisporale]|nr:hypothetical protein BGZ52_000904 [Haplosporangium bisporale]KAF9216380.1 hypothetical protein BGZ59_009989 [Podila verticillata]KFH65758.1 hypothetical protein MVEG_07862 [Podila verticillata NRRL 6337]